VERTPLAAYNPKRMHMHVYLKLNHTSNVKLSYECMKDLTEEILQPYGVNGVYLTIKSAPVGIENIMEYLGKKQK